MNTKQILIASAISLALVGNAQAGIKDRLAEMKSRMTTQPQAAQTVQASPAEFSDCQKFLKDQKAGKVALSAATGAKFDRCNQVINGATTLETVQVKGQAEQGKMPVDKGKALQSAGMGATIGAGIGVLLGVNPNHAMAAGALVGGLWSFKKQIKDARAVEAAAREAGMDATVRTEQRVDEKGKKQEALAALTIRYEAADMEEMGPKTVAMLDRLASLADKSKATLTIRFEGKKACQIPLMELNNRKALERHTVVNECGKSNENRIVVSPLPVPAR